MVSWLGPYVSSRYGRVVLGGVGNSLTRLKFLSFQINGGIRGNEYFVSHQIKTTKRTNPIIMRHRVTGDVQPSVGPRLYTGQYGKNALG